jgi:hypothetical protein
MLYMTKLSEITDSAQLNFSSYIVLLAETWRLLRSERKR